MATNRDVKMTLSVDTLGEDGIKSLQKSIQSLAAEGGDAAPEFQKLADEVGRLGEQSKALTAFKDLGAATEALATKQTEAVASSQRLSAQLAELRANTDAAKVKQTEAAAAMAAGQVATLEASSALRLLKADYDNAGKQTAEFRSKQTELIAAQTAAKVALIELRAAQKNANTELADAEVAQKKVERAYTNTNKSVDAATAALSKQEIAVKEAAAATEKLGLSATDVAASEGVLLAALNKVGSEAAQHSAAIKEIAESDRLLAIQERALAELYARGADALQAETLAQRDADRSNADYAASLAKVNAEKARSVDTAAQWQREAEAIVNAAEASQKLERDTVDLLNAERQLAATNAFAQQADDAKKLVQAADYVQFWTTELDRADAAAKQLQGAFNALNVRSAEAIKADITAVRSALETVRSQATATGQSLSGAFDAGKAKIQALEREMRQLNGTMTLGDKAAGVLSNSLGQISAGNIVADGVGYLVNKVKELGRAFIEAVVQGDQMRRGLNAVYKDTELTARQIDFLRKTASESGVSLGALSGEFVRFSASMKSANVPMAESNALFRAVTAASASLGLGAEATSGALNALGQMASKGTVSMEELRQQLGDRLPGALGLAAKGMGITEGQLIALVSSGGLATRDFIVPFTNALETMRGEVDGLTPAWGRFGTALTTIAQNSGDAGWVQILTVALKGLAGIVGTVVMSFSLASEGVIFLAKAMTAAAARMMGDKDAFKFLAEEADKAATRINASNEALKNVINPSAAAAAATSAHAAAMTTATAEVTKAIAANSALSAEQKLLALSTALAADKTLDASAKMVQYGVAASELIGKQGQQIEAFGKLAKAAKEEGDTLVALAKLTGDVNAVQVASVQAAELHATALDKLTQAQSSELAMLVAQKTELLTNAKQRNLTELQIKTQVDALDALIKKSEAETVQTQQASAAAAQLVLERRLLIATTKDHSAEVDKLRAAMELAARVSAVYEEAARRGAVTDAQAMEKRRELTTATALYKDGLNDVVTALNAKQIAEKANATVLESNLNSQKSYYKAMEDNARAVGDYKTALIASIEQKRIDIAIINAKVAAMRAEASGAIAVAKAELAVLDASGKVDIVRRAQIESSIKIAEAKKNEAAALGLSSEAYKREIEQLYVNLNAVGMNTGSTDQNTDAKLRNAAATNAQTVAEGELAKKLGGKSNFFKGDNSNFAGFGGKTNTDGGTGTNSLPIDKAWALRDKVRSGQMYEVTQAEWDEAKKQADDAALWLSQSTLGNSPQATLDARDMQRAVDAAKSNIVDPRNPNAQSDAALARSKNTTPGRLANAAQTTSAQPTPVAAASTKTVTIVINGRSQAVNVASDADATALTSILRTLETAANTSS